MIEDLSINCNRLVLIIIQILKSVPKLPKATQDEFKAVAIILESMQIENIANSISEKIAQKLKLKNARSEEQDKTL